MEVEDDRERGGELGGGLPILRPDLHFFYNLIETTPLVIAFMEQVQRQRTGRLAPAPARAAHM